MKRAFVVGIGAGLAALLSFVAVAWACTPTHTGNHWFCTSSSGCGEGFRINSWLPGATIYIDIEGAAASTTYTLKYRTGTDQADVCHDSPTGNWGTATTNGSGKVVQSVNTSGFTGGGTSYTSCPINGTSSSGTAPTHRTFTLN